MGFLKAHWHVILLAALVLAGVGMLEHLLRVPATKKVEDTNLQVRNDSTTKVVVAPTVTHTKVTRTAYARPDAGAPCRAPVPIVVTVTDTTTTAGGSTTVTQVDDREALKLKETDTKAGTEAPRWLVEGLVGASTRSGVLYGAHVGYRVVGPLVVGVQVLAGPSEAVVGVGIGVTF